MGRPGRFCARPVGLSLAGSADSFQVLRAVELAERRFWFETQLSHAAVGDVVIAPGEGVVVQQLPEQQAHGGAVAYDHHLTMGVRLRNRARRAAHAIDDVAK